jgi:spermidine/putrescine transport system substrate-binding protein
MARKSSTVLTLLVGAVLAGSTALAQSDELYLYNWTNYTAPEVVERFEEETGIRVVLDTYTSNEDLMARLQAGGAGYDVALPSDSYVQRLIEEDLLVPFDATQLENFENVMAPHDAPFYDPERMYSAPYMLGTTGIAYDSAVAEGEELPHSWDVIFNPPEPFHGEIAMLDNIGEVTTAAAFLVGVDPCTESPEDWQRIQDVLLEQRPHVKRYNSSGTHDSMIAGEVLMHQMWNGAAHRAFREKESIRYLYPEEGVVFWMDNMVIPRGARNVENAKKFINFMMSPEAAAMSSNFTGCEAPFLVRRQNRGGHEGACGAGGEVVVSVPPEAVRVLQD